MATLSPDAPSPLRARAAPKTTYHALDGLRGIAALLVVVYHAEYVIGVALVPNGYLAVDLFFALSGFVIAHAYDRRLAGGLGVGRFALMRVVRFWPLYALGLGLGVLLQFAYHATGSVQAMAPEKIWAAVLLNGGFVPALFPTYGNVLFPLNPVSWSLFFELLVNILYACFLPLLTRRVIGGLTLVSGIVLAFTVALHGTANVGWSSTEVWLGLVRTVFSFSAGVLICRMGLAGPRVPFWLLAGVVVLCLCVPMGEALQPLGALLFILLLSPMIVATGTRTKVSSRTMEMTVMLGAMSYGLYALHRPLLSFANMAVKFGGVPGPVMFLAYMAALCPLCIMLDRHFDGPVRRRIARRLGLSRPVVQPA